MTAWSACRISALPWRHRLRFGMAVTCGLVWLAAAQPATAQFGQPGPPAPRQPPPPPERVYPGAVDRPLQPPEILREDRIDPDSGVQIGLGPHFVALEYPKLKIHDEPSAGVSEGVMISANVLLGDLRLGYSRQFYRRVLPAGSQLDGKRANFLAVDADQFWATLGWRPSFRVFLGVSAGVEYRLVRVRDNATDLVARTETLPVAAMLADVLIATPFSLQVWLAREDPGRDLQLRSAIVQVAYLIPF